MKVYISLIVIFFLSAVLTFASEGTDSKNQVELYATAKNAEKVIFENGKEQKANSVMLFDNQGNLIKAKRFDAPTKLDSIEIKIEANKERLLSAYIEFDSGATKMLKVNSGN